MVTDTLCVSNAAKRKRVRNRPAERAYHAAYRAKHRAKLRAQRMAWLAAPEKREGVRSQARRYANSAKGRAQNTAYKAAHPAMARKSSAAYYRRNKWKYVHWSRMRQARQLQATPIWLTPEQIREIEAVYGQAKFFERMSGVKCHVDHIEPLQGKDRCGLHVPWNLRVVAAHVNLSKSNKPFEPDALAALEPDYELA